MLFPTPLLEALASDPDRTVIEHGSRIVSGGELLATIGGLVAALRRAGLGPGRGVAMHTAMTPDAFAAHVAAHALGCRVAGLRPGWTGSQLAGALADVDAIVGDPATLTPELVAVTRPATLLSLGAAPGAMDLLTPSRHPADASPRAEASPDDIARLNFTSGSTGRPKACARTYRTFSLAYQPDRWAPELARLVARCGRFLAYGSWSIPVMLTFAGRALITGGTVVVAGDLPGHDPLGGLHGAIAQHRITAVAMTVPALHRVLAQVADTEAGLPSLEALVVTGSPASPTLIATATERLGPVVWQGYGQAESGMIALLTPDDLARSPVRALSSVGRPLPEVEISVRDADDRPVAPGELGEICVRSPHVMAGYWRDPEQTAEILRDGWLHTRDLGHVDGAGLLHLTGRDRDVIIVDAEVCYATAIERALARHPHVDQAHVVGVPDQRTGEAVHAFVVPATGHTPEPGALAESVRAELTEAHVPRTITFLPDVPVAPSGKPDKAALAALAAAVR